MKPFGQIAAATFAAVAMLFTAAAPAQAIVDQNGNVVGVILTPDGNIYY